MKAEAAVVAGDRCLDSIAGTSLLVRAVTVLLDADAFDRVYVFTGPSVDQAAAVAACAPFPVEVRPCDAQRGCDVRRDAFRALCSRADAVVVHDAARGIAPVALVRAVLVGLEQGHDVVIPVLPLTDTVKVVNAGLVRATPDRACLRVVQSPQGFRSAVLAAHAGPDPLRSVLMADAVAVHTVPGDPLAFAVRTPWDVRLAELLVEEGET